MDLSEKDKFGLEKGGGEENLSYHQSGIPSDWRFGNPPPPSMSLAPANQMGSSSPCPSVSMVDSFCPTLWDHPSNSQNLGFSETSDAGNVPIIRPVPGPSRLDIAWNPPDSMTKGGAAAVAAFLQAGAGILPPGMSQFPADTAFIERAARFSCFNGGNFGGMVNPFGINESLSPYSNSPRTGISRAHSQKSEANMGEASKDVAGGMSVDQGSNGGSPMNSQKNLHGGVRVSGNESGEGEFSGSGQEEAPSTKRGFAAKKRQRNTQEMEIDQAKGEPGDSVETGKENADTQQKDEQNNSTLATIKPNVKNGKDSTDAPKEDYIHVRARRGQATNSHSLAERVRREKISERMKFLQDLVPGCSKVTGKAVMLDEIINYVQSLQRQVEFLSMKLAAVNPQLDFNIEGLLSKDILQSRAGSSSTMGFSPDMVHPLLHSNPQGLAPSGISSMGAPSDALRRVINAQLTAMNTYREAKHQMPNAWDDELHNVISQMGFGANPPLNIQDLNGSLPSGHMKAEL